MGSPASWETKMLITVEIFMTGLLQFVFGLEMTARALRVNRFAPSRKYATLVCMSTTLGLMLPTWLSSRLRQPSGACFGDMIWRSITGATFGALFCGILIPSFLIMAGIIGYQLYRTIQVDQNERVAATRMVYFLLLSATTYVCISLFLASSLLTNNHRSWSFHSGLKSSLSPLTAS